MLEIVESILQLSATSISEFINSSLSDGVISAAYTTIRKHFKSTETIQQYYKESLKRSVLSLEIALKGPRSFYPKKEQEFYQKHFMSFENNVFQPFSREVIEKGQVRSDEELRNSCVQECETIKKVAPRVLGIESLPQNNVQEILERMDNIDPALSKKMLEMLANKGNFIFLIRLLEKENVLLSGIVFHFHTFLQNDPNFSNYVNYLQIESLSKNLADLQRQIVTHPQDCQIQSRVQRLEQVVSMLSSYENRMGEIGKKLDSLYEKTVEMYDIIQQMAVEMRSSFSLMDHKLDFISSLLQKQNQSISPTPTVMIAPVQPAVSILPSSSPAISILPLQGQRQALPAGKTSLFITGSSEEPSSPEASPYSPHKYRRNTMPGEAFGIAKNKVPSGVQVDNDQNPKNGKEAAQEKNQEEKQSEKTSAHFDDCLLRYSIFLKQIEETPSSNSSTETKANTDDKANTEGKATMAQQPASESKKTKRVRADKVSNIFFAQNSEPPKPDEP